MNYRSSGLNGSRALGSGLMNGSRNRSLSIADSNVCKIVVLGCPGVGKTALTVRYLTNRFIGEYCPSLENIYKCYASVDEEDVRMEILDTAGPEQEGWKDAYALWADCFVFVYSITDRYSFDEMINIKRQVDEVRRSTSVCGILVGNKIDLLHDRQVPANEATELADEIGCTFQEVSAADWTQVDEIKKMFHGLYREYKRQKYAREGRQRKTSSSIKFRQAIQKVISGKTPAKKTF